MQYDGLVCNEGPLVYAQKKTIFATEKDSERVQGLRAHHEKRQESLKREKLIFIDESGHRLGATNRYGWAIRGEKAIGSEPHGDWKTMTMIGAMSATSVRAFMTIDAPTDKDVFSAFVTSMLLPQIKKGDIVVMDNLGAHKNGATIREIQKAGAEVLFLPPYSPDLNPIEKLWSKLKEFIRRCETNTRELFEAAVNLALQNITRDDLKGWITDCGYRIN